MTDIDRHDERDDQLDRNLLAAAHHLELPTEPSPLQRARWKTPAPPDASARKKGILGMKRERFWQVLGGCGALAACVTVAVVLGLGGAKTVEAAAIFDSLRAAIRNSLWMEIDNVQSDDITVNGRVLLVFDDTAGDAVNANDNGDADRISASYVDLHVQASDDNPDFPGLDLEVAAGMKPGSEWAFVQTHHIPQTLFDQAPMLGMFAPMLNNGLLLDVAALDQSIGSHQSVGAGANGGPVARFTFSTGGNNDAADDVTAESDDDSSTILNLSFSTTQSSDDNMPTGDDTADAVNEELHETMFGSDFHVSSDSPEAAAAIEAHMQMVKDFITGRLSPEQVQQFIDMVQQSASETTVTPNPDGSYLLRASGFDFGDFANSDDDIALEIVYRDDTGIDSVDLLNIGEGTGRLRFTFSEDDANADVFDRSRYAQRPGVRSVSSLGDLLGFGTPATADDE